MGAKATENLKVIKLTALVVALALAGCGSSSDDSGAPVASSSSSSAMQSSSAAAGNSAPVVDAGVAVTVDSGEQVQLQASASDADGTIESIAWRQLSGPRALLQQNDDKPEVVTFKAPSPGRADSAQMQLEVTATDNDGASVSDTVTVSIKRVNQAPVVELGGLRALRPTPAVTLHATAYDLDGEIDSYLWQQVAGEPVTLSDIDRKTARFDASQLEGDARLEFRLTVTDNDGAQGADQVTVVLTNQDVPVVKVAFPPDRSATSATSISAFGSVAVEANAGLAKVVVDAGIAPVTATLDADGNWRAEGVQLPTGVNKTRLTITAYDSEGRIGYAGSEVVLDSNSAVGYGTSWVQSKAMLLSPDATSAWVMADGDLNDDLKLIQIDLNNGRRQAAITDFSDIGQGVSHNSYEDFVYDASTEQFYLSSTVYPDDDKEADPVGKILQVDAVSGARSELALTGVDAEDALISPKGLYLHTDDNLYIADQLSAALVRVDLASKQVHSVYEGEPVSGDFYAPDRLAYDPLTDRLFVSVGGIGTVDLAAVTLTEPAQMQVISEGDGISFGPIPIGFATGLAVDEDNNRAYMTTSLDNGVVQIELSDGSRTLLAEAAFEGQSNAQGLIYDRASGVIYVVKGRDYQQKLLAIDALSGATVVVSQSRF